MRHSNPRTGLPGRFSLLGCLFATALLMLLVAPSQSGAGAWGQSNPVPLINQPLVPDVATPGGPGFTLNVNGTGFVSGSVVEWNNSPLETTFVSGSKLTAVVPASDVGNPSTAAVTVLNPETAAASNTQFFSITRPTAGLGFSRITSAVGNYPYSVTTADLKGNGILDIVTTDQNQNNNAISVLIGNGDGTFQPPVSYSVNGYPTQIAVGDFNGDSKLDLAVGISNSLGQVAVFTGNGDGTFQTPQYFNAGFELQGVISGDFNRDGKLDLAVAFGNISPEDVAMLLGNGDGTFQSPVSYYADSGPSGSLTAGDFNGDGNLDLAVSAYNDQAIAILLGNGDGTFQSSVEYATASGPSGIVAADLNGDGNLDIAVADLVRGGTSGAISVLLGSGNGTFQSHVDYTTEAFASTITSADLNADDKLDLAVVGQTDGTMLSFLGNGDGTFRGPAEYSFGVGSGPSTLTVGDYGGTGRLSVATATSGTAAVTVLPQISAILSPTIASFGKVKVGGSSNALNAKLTNAGLSSFNVSNVALTGKSQSSFVETNTCRGKTLSPGMTCQISIIFRPTTRGAASAAVDILDNASAVPQIVFLAGTGVE